MTTATDSDERLDDLDRAILRFASCHPLVLLSQIQKLLDLEEAEVAARVARLDRDGLIRCGVQLRRQQGACQPTAAGLAAIGSELPVPRVDLRRYWHDIAVVWLCVAVRRGMFGPVDRSYTQREMRVADERAADRMSSAADAEWSPTVRAKVMDASFGLALEGTARGSAGLQHYPDVVLVLPLGRMAMEFVWELPSPRQLELIFDAYERKRSVVAMLLFFVDPVVGGRLRALQAQRGWLEQRARIERLSFSLDSG